MKAWRWMTVVAALAVGATGCGDDGGESGGEGSADVGEGAGDTGEGAADTGEGAADTGEGAADTGEGAADTDEGAGDAGEENDAGDAGEGDDAGGESDAGAEGCVLAPVSCEDQSILELALLDSPSDGAVTNEPAGDGYISTVDATGGGLTPTESYVYARFEEGGLVKVDLDDEAALDDPTWHIAFRRYVIRLNSGVSGPSCVTAARVPPGQSFAEVAAVPEGVELRVEQYFTDSCDLITDGSGLGGPGTALSSYWSYPGCVSMSGNVYVVGLPDGEALKLQILSYYEPSVQEYCDLNGETPQGPTGSATIRLQWELLK
jgi:hypothetical protein